jgi:hypothetical protein
MARGEWENMPEWFDELCAGIMRGMDRCKEHDRIAYEARCALDEGLPRQPTSRHLVEMTFEARRKGA